MSSLRRFDGVKLSLPILPVRQMNQASSAALRHSPLLCTSYMTSPSENVLHVASSINQSEYIIEDVVAAAPVRK